LPFITLDDDRLSQLIVNVVSAILDGNGAATLATGDHSDWFATVAAKRQQKRLERFIISFDPLNDVLLAFFSYGYVHDLSPD
jgi:hypothetical protein